ncbi:MAG: O-antigen ligase family protein [Planctomycetes bacterium]|nr:O-antigen ligase family protein [Planctomycetota bacterium]MBL7040614.1 O-antigen ligase family protein [Pirellulaceae bacterium]
MSQRTDASQGRSRQSRKRHRSSSHSGRRRRERAAPSAATARPENRSDAKSLGKPLAHPADGVALQLVDTGLLAVLFVAPLFMGGRHPLGRLVLVSIVCATALTWLIGQCKAKSGRWIPSGSVVLIALGMLVVLLQLVPLPYSILTRLSPSLTEILPVWSPEGAMGARLGAWSHVSLIPQATREGLTMYLCYAMLFLLVVQRIRRLEDIERWMRWIALAALLLAVIGLVQYFAGNGRYLWIYEHPFRDSRGAVKGPFVNQNHCAHFLALGIGPLCWWTYGVWSEHGSKRHTGIGRNLVQREWRQLRKPATVVIVALVALAGLLTLSRGGVAAVALAAAVCVGIYASRMLFGRKSVLALAISASVVVAGVYLYGREALTQELSTITDSESLEELSHGRKKLWEADLRALPDFLVLGTGIGSHRMVYPMYLEEKHHVTYTHAENGYLQVMLEAGGAGLALLLVGIVLCGWWCVQTFRQSRSPRVVACLGAIGGGLTVSVMHSFVDFVWYIPACMSLTVILAACAWRLSQVTRSNNDKPADGAPLHRLVWIASAAAVAGVSFPMIGSLASPARAAPHADHYRAIARNGASIFDGDPELIDECVIHLERVLERNPNDAQAHLNMAHLCLRKFHLEQQSSDMNMPLVQIRDAALASHFPSREALDRWLAAAIGDRYQYLRKALVHSRQAVRLCPLQGEAYVYLVEMTFLESPGEHAKHAYIEQALKVRPHSAAVNFAVGREAALAGDSFGALEHFKASFGLDPYFRSRIIEMFVGQDADFFFRHFEPDLNAMRLLGSHYAGLGRDADARKVNLRCAAMLGQAAGSATGRDAANLWLETQRVYDELGERERAIQSAKRAVDAAPNHYQSRRNLATVLMEGKRYDEALPHLEWCLLRYPENEKLKEDLELAARRAAPHHGSGKPVENATFSR